MTTTNLTTDLLRRLALMQHLGEDYFIHDGGRGHSLSSYDGEENEENVEGETFYIYRIN